MPNQCSAVDCKNHNMKAIEGLSFHIFPSGEKEPEKRKKWIQACKRVNEDGSPWNPQVKFIYLCNAHFIQGKPSKNPEHPDYVPSVFTFVQQCLEKMEKKVKRFENLKRRNEEKDKVMIKKAKVDDDSLTAPTEAAVLTIKEEVEKVDVSNDCDFSVEVDLANCSTPSRHLSKYETTNTQEMDLLPEIETSAESRLTDEISFLKEEKSFLYDKIQTLEEKICITRFNIKLVKNDDVRCKYLTGITWKTFEKVCQFIRPHILIPRTNLEPSSQLLMVLVRLCLNIPLGFLSIMTGLAQSTMSTTFTTVVNIMFYKLKFLIKWADRDYIFSTIPPHFKNEFPRLTSIIDCFEIFIERPNNLKARAEVYSNYKKHSTVKFLISCSPLGAINFVSSSFGGRTSDVNIVRESGFISSKYHNPYDQILADRGFTLEDEFAATCSAELIIPAFTKGKDQLSAKDVETTRKIAHVRIHIERVIGVLKNRFAMLQGTVSLQLVKSAHNEVLDEVPNIDKLVNVCAALVNLSKSIVYKEAIGCSKDA